MRPLAAAFLAFLSFATWLPATLAIEAKCSACISVGMELQGVLEQERPKNDLDLRHRLDPQGVRRGKIVDYKSSEQRVTDLLDDLCEKLKSYLYDGTKKEWLLVTDPDDRKRKWGKALAEARSKEIRSYCGMLLEEYEEEIGAEIRNGRFDDSPDEIVNAVCHEISGHCKNKVPVPSAAGGTGEEASGEGTNAAARQSDGEL